MDNFSYAPKFSQDASGASPFSHEMFHEQPRQQLAVDIMQAVLGGEKPTAEMDAQFLSNTTFDSRDMQESISKHFGELDIDINGALSEEELNQGASSLPLNDALQVFAAGRASFAISQLSDDNNDRWLGFLGREGDLTPADINRLGDKSLPYLGIDGLQNEMLENPDEEFWASVSMYSQIIKHPYLAEAYKSTAEEISFLGNLFDR